MCWTLRKKYGGTLMMCGICEDVPRGHVLYNIVISPSGTIWSLSSHVRRSHLKTKQAKSKPWLKIDPDWGEDINASPFWVSSPTSLKVTLFLISCNLSAAHMLTLYLCFDGFSLPSGSHLTSSYWSACSTL